MNELKNKYGGERAICPKCLKPNSDLYQYLADDFRELECSECNQLSPFRMYFMRSLNES